MRRARVPTATRGDRTVCTCPGPLLVLVQSFYLHSMAPTLVHGSPTVCAQLGLHSRRSHTARTPLSYSNCAAWARAACQLSRERGHGYYHTITQTPRRSSQESWRDKLSPDQATRPLHSLTKPASLHIPSFVCLFLFDFSGSGSDFIAQAG